VKEAGWDGTQERQNMQRGRLSEENNGSTEKREIFLTNSGISSQYVWEMPVICCFFDQI
jgi:hypothetical protein